jgi:pimeloyl-ACP methyl ester carboxylesterase
MPTAYSRMMGIPKGFQPSSREAEGIAAARELLFPLKPPARGRRLRRLRVEPGCGPVPLEQLTVPTLVISARDDPLAPCRLAVKAASRIPGGKLVTVKGGGHFFMGHDAEVRREIGAFVQGVT